MDVDSEQKDEEFTCRHGCGKWSEEETVQKSYLPSSNTSLLNAITVQPDEEYEGPRLSFYFKPHRLPPGTTYEDICDNMTMTVDINNEYIKFTIVHAEYIRDPTLQDMLRQGFGPNPKGRALLKGYYAILIVIGMHHRNITSIHSSKEFIGNPQLTEIMPRWKLEFFCRNFRITNVKTLPAKNSPQYHSYQNINAGIELVRQKSISLFDLGLFFTYDEGRVTQTSKRMKTTRNPQKPIKVEELLEHDIIYPSLSRIGIPSELYKEAMRYCDKDTEISLKCLKQ
eukprot:192834_1